MKIVIDIPDNEVPKRREIVEIVLQFMEGEVCECTYPFQVLSKGYGRLIDADAYQTKLEEKAKRLNNLDTINGLCGAVALLSDTETIIEADKGE